MGWLVAGSIRPGAEVASPGWPSQGTTPDLGGCCTRWHLILNATDACALGMTAVVIEPLETARHRRAEFACERPELTDFLQKRARKEMEARALACFVLVVASDPGRIVGY